MQKVIAKIRLNPGHGGFFDPITRIHLTHGEPEADVFAGMNTTALKAAVRNRRISLISGSLGEYRPPFKLVRNANGKIAIMANEITEEKSPAKKSEPTKKTESPKKVESVTESAKENTLKVEDTPVSVSEIKEDISQKDIVTEIPVEESVQDVMPVETSVSEQPKEEFENPFEDISLDETSEQPEETTKKKKKKK